MADDEQPDIPPPEVPKEPHENLDPGQESPEEMEKQG